VKIGAANISLSLDTSREIEERKEIRLQIEREDVT
jgi:hypothetical protein